MLKKIIQSILIFVIIFSYSPKYAFASSSIFSDSFGSSSSNTVSGWTETESGASKARITTSSPRAGSTTGHVRLTRSTSIQKTVDLSGFENIYLKYYWRGDSDAENTGDNADYLKVYWKKSSDTDFILLNSHTDPETQDDWSDEISLSLDDATNESIDIKFTSYTTADNEEIRIDDISIVGDELLENTLELCSDDTDNDLDEDTDLEDEDCSSFKPKLTITKIVINDDEAPNTGTKVVADFSLFVGETEVSSGTENTFMDGDYSISETNDEGYTATFSGDCNEEGDITLEAGDTKSCTITNNDSYVPPPSENTLVLCTDTLDNDEDESVDLNDPDCESFKPKLTVNKIVINDNGRSAISSDFNLFVGETSVSSGIQNIFNVGNFVISETASSTYTATFSGDCDISGNISLSAGDVKVCTITNNDIAPVVCESGFHREGEVCVADPVSEVVEESEGRSGSSRRNNSGGQVLGAFTENTNSTTTQTTTNTNSNNSTCEEYIKTYIKFGQNNDVEDVKRLQIFLNEHMKANIPITGFYGEITMSWVKKLQEMHKDEILTPWGIVDPTGYVYKTTKRFINIKKCPGLANQPIAL